MASAFVRRLPATRAALDPWFPRAAEGADVFAITDDAVDWVYAPYDGGGDVIAPTIEARDALSAMFRRMAVTTSRWTVSELDDVSGRRSAGADAPFVLSPRGQDLG
jgi:hypothetical protein